MAEYKGLTIRIGGDTSQLNSALKASTKSAASLQSQIRQVTRAMKFDPGALANVETRMKLTTDRAEALNAKLNLVSNAYEKLGDEVMSIGGEVGTVRELAEATDNVALSAKVADERYNEMTKNLASRYRELEARARAAGEEMDLSALSRQSSDTTFEKQMAQLREIGVVTDEEIQKLREMRKVWHEAFGDKSTADSVAQFRAMEADMQRLESEARNMVATVRELNTVSKYSSENWTETNAKVRSMDSALESAAKQARAYEAAIREDPSNVGAAVGRLRALSNEYGTAQSKAEALTEQVNAYRSRLAGVIAEHKNLPAYIQRTGDEWQRVQNELSEAKGEASALHQSLQRLKDMQAPDEEIQKLNARVDAADQKVRELNVRAREMDAAFETAKECSEMQQLETELSQTTSHVNSLRRSMEATSLGNLGAGMFNPSTIKSLGMTLYSTVTPAVTMLGWRAVTAAEEIDSAYRNMRKTVNGTEEDFERLRDGAIEFSQTHVTSADQLLEIEAIGGELGVATKNLEDFAITVSNIDIATNLDTEAAATTLGQFANITHMAAEDYNSFADALVRLGNNGASTESQIADISIRIGSMGTIIGMSQQDILAWSATLAATGQKTEAVGTAFSNTMSGIESAVSAGGNALQQYADVAGMSAEEFAAAWDSDPTAALQAFIEGLNRIEADGGSAVATLESMGITGERQKQAILGLMQTVGGLDANLQMSRDAWAGVSDQWGEAGDAAREAERKAEGFSGQLQIMKNIANDALASLAEGAVPWMKLIADMAKGALDRFENMGEVWKTAIVGILGISAAAGPVLTFAATIMTAYGNVKKFVTQTSAMGKALQVVRAEMASAPAGMSRFRAGLNGMSAAAGGLVKSFLKTSAITLAITAVVAGIALLVKKYKDWKHHQELIADAAETSADRIGRAMGRASDSVSELTDASGEAAQSYEEYLEAVSDRNEQLQQSADETWGDTAMIEHYGETIASALQKQADGATLSADEMAELQAAVNNYNSLTGESISVTQDESGVLHVLRDDAELTADAFDRLTQSKVNAAKAEYFAEDYEANYSNYQDALDQIPALEDKKAQLEAEIAEIEQIPMRDRTGFDQLRLGKLNSELDRTEQELAEVNSQLGQYQTNMDHASEMQTLLAKASSDGATAFDRLLASNDAATNAIAGNQQSVMDFDNAINLLGDDFANSLDDQQVYDLAAAWDGTMGSILPLLSEYGVALDENTLALLGFQQRTAEVDGTEVKYYVSDDGTILDAEGNITTVQELGIDPKDFDVNAHTNEAIAKINAVEWMQIHDKPVNVTANTSGFWSGIAAIMNSNLTKNVRVNEVRSARGNMFPLTRDIIPAHAAGALTGSIVTGPTLTNVGWVGEDGAEAIMRWANGSAVVPLTNRQYVRPFAHAVASEMPSGYSGPSASDIAMALASLNLQVRMDTGELVGVLVSNSQRRAAMNVG